MFISHNHPPYLQTPLLVSKQAHDSNKRQNNRHPYWADTLARQAYFGNSLRNKSKSKFTMTDTRCLHNFSADKRIIKRLQQKQTPKKQRSEESKKKIISGINSIRYSTNKKKTKKRREKLRARLTRRG